MNLKLKIGGKVVGINGVKNLSTSGKFKGLMFSRREKSRALLFEFKKPASIHSFFVFFDFLILWMDNKNNVVEWKIVKPFSWYEKSSRKFTKIIEIPVNQKYHSIVTFIVGERFKKKRNIGYKVKRR